MIWRTKNTDAHLFWLVLGCALDSSCHRETLGTAPPDLATTEVATTKAATVAKEVPAESTAVRSLYQSPYCGTGQQGLTRITEERLRALLGTSSEIQEPLISQKEILVLVSLGEKSSGGYGVELAAEIAPIEQQTAWLPLRVVQPEPGSMQTMQLTNPCVVVGLSAGPVKHIGSKQISGLLIIE